MGQWAHPAVICVQPGVGVVRSKQLGVKGSDSPVASLDNASAIVGEVKQQAINTGAFSHGQKPAPVHGVFRTLPGRHSIKILIKIYVRHHSL